MCWLSTYGLGTWPRCTRPGPDYMTCSVSNRSRHKACSYALFLFFQVDVKQGVTVPWYRHGVGKTEIDKIKVAWYHALLMAGWEGTHTLHLVYLSHPLDNSTSCVTFASLQQACISHPWHNSSSSWFTVSLVALQILRMLAS